MNNSFDGAASVVALLIGIGVLYFLGILVAIAYYILLWIVWQRYRFAAAAAFDEVMREHGDYDARDVAYDLFGVRPEASGSHPVAEILFGVEVKKR